MNIIPIREENQVILSKIEIERKKERKEGRINRQNSIFRAFAQKEKMMMMLMTRMTMRADP